MYLHKNIKYLRKSKGYNQKKLGELLGVTGAQVGSYERGTNDPKFDSLLVLSEVFDVLIDDLITKDLELEKARPAGKLPKNKEEEEEMLVTLNKLLLKRVKQLEDHVKKTDPDLAERWGIE